MKSVELNQIVMYKSPTGLVSRMKVVRINGNNTADLVPADCTIHGVPLKDCKEVKK